MLLSNMWAGLLASSCTETGDDDSNWIICEQYMLWIPERRRCGAGS